MDEVNLAVHVALEHFGPIVSSVVRVLLFEPQCSIHRICMLARSHGNFSFQDIQNSLAVLFQHGVAYFSTNLPNTALYSIDVERILLRCRYAEFLRIAAMEYDDLGAQITKLFFRRGMLTIKDVFNLLEQVGQLEVYPPHEVENLLLNMVKDGLLRTVGDLSRPNFLGEETKNAEKISREDDKPYGEFVEVGAAELGDDKERVPYPRRANDKVLWQVSTWYLIRLMRLSVCANVVKVQLDDSDAVQVMGTALRYALSIEDQRNPRDGTFTTRLGTKAVKAYMDEMSDPENIIGLETLYAKIRLMASSEYRYLTIENEFNDGNPAFFRIEVAHLICLVREQTVDNIIHMKSGIYGKRIFRSLVRCGNLEENQVADKVMMPIKNACAELHKLYGLHFIYKQEIPKSSDIRAQNCFYLWGVNLNRVHTRVTNELYQTMCNLYTVLQKIRKAKAEAPASENLRKLQYQEDAVELQILRTDHAVMLFRDLGPFIETTKQKHIR